MAGAASGAIAFVCPACRSQLDTRDSAYTCPACGRTYPIVCGIADFRLAPDPYIGIEDDRRKAERLFAEGASRTFEELLRHYYAITPEDPGDLAERWIARALAEVDIASGFVEAVGWRPPADAPLLDVGCSTGALLIARARHHPHRTGVDVALRWLAVGRIRLRDAGVDATLVCANAEHLPFADGSFGAVTCLDTLEHTRDARAALREARRVSRPGGRLLCTANNRLAPLPEPNIHLWGVAYLPRRLQAAYVRWRRQDLHPYQIRLMSPRELRGAAVTAGFEHVEIAAAPIVAPHASRRLRSIVRIYDAVRRLPPITALVRVLGPKLVLTAAATPSNATAPSGAGRAGR